MKVRLKYRKLEDLPSKERQEILRKYGGYDFYYLKNKEYTVYGMFFLNDVYMCCIQEDGDEYPTPNPIDFFEIVDDRLSKYWKISSYVDYQNRFCISMLFDEWRDIPHFDERLLDGDPEIEEIFLKYKKLMDEEFMDE